MSASRHESSGGRPLIGMDWKRFYAAELADPRGRAAMTAALARHRGGDARLSAALRAGAIVSFPHVTIRDSADSIASVVEAILALRAKRVVALGVLHASVLPAEFNDEFATLRDDTARGHETFARRRGAFVDTSAVVTASGRIDETILASADPLLHDEPAVLRHEFSLDLFLAFLAAGARAHDVAAPEVIRLYVSTVRDPSGGFATARSLAGSIARLLDDDAVCVATGDVAHLGHGYGADDETARLPAQESELKTLLAASLREMHDAALGRHDFATAWNIGTRLRSDQRQILPVIAELLGPGASCDALALRLSDYADINGQPRPCFVAAALNLFSPRA